MVLITLDSYFEYLCIIHKYGRIHIRKSQHGHTAFTDIISICRARKTTQQKKTGTQQGFNIKNVKKL